MYFIEKIADEKIREAQKRGDFDNLPGSGKPVDLKEYFQTPPHLRAAYTVLKNSGVPPEEVHFINQISHLKKRWLNETDKKLKVDLEKEMSFKISQLRMTLEKRRKSDDRFFK
jgi:hypothetical protein